MSEQTLFDILLWLPVASLLRFRTVCKSWFSLIESSSFVNQHLHHHSGKDNLIVKPRNLEFHLFSGNKYEVYANVEFDKRLERAIRPDGGRVNFVDSCNGIICLQNRWSGDVALWNPALKQLRPLPRSSIPYRVDSVDGDWQYTTFGFGFDARVNDYKVVRIMWHSKYPRVNQVELYNLRTSFSWRIIHTNGDLPFTCIYHDSDRATSKNGTCFWLGLNNEDHILVSFDLKDEIIRTMLLPENQEFDTGAYALEFLNDKLAYVKSGRFEGRLEIWVLHEFGMKDSWKKIYNIGPIIPNMLSTPISFSKNGEFLILKTSEHLDIGELYLCNLATWGGSYHPIQEPNPYYLYSFRHYNESLVSLKKVGNVLAN